MFCIVCVLLFSSISGWARRVQFAEQTSENRVAMLNLMHARQDYAHDSLEALQRTLLLALGSKVRAAATSTRSSEMQMQPRISRASTIALGRSSAMSASRGAILKSGFAAVVAGVVSGASASADEAEVVLEASPSVPSIAQSEVMIVASASDAGPEAALPASGSEVVPGETALPASVVVPEESASLVQSEVAAVASESEAVPVASASVAEAPLVLPKGFSGVVPATFGKKEKTEELCTERSLLGQCNKFGKRTKSVEDQIRNPLSDSWLFKDKLGLQAPEATLVPAEPPPPSDFIKMLKQQSLENREKNELAQKERALGLAKLGGKLGIGADERLVLRQDGTEDVIKKDRFKRLKREGKITQKDTNIDKYAPGFDPDAPEPERQKIFGIF